MENHYQYVLLLLLINIKTVSLRFKELNTFLVDTSLDNGDDYNNKKDQQQQQ